MDSVLAGPEDEEEVIHLHITSKFWNGMKSYSLNQCAWLWHWKTQNDNRRHRHERGWNKKQESTDRSLDPPSLEGNAWDSMRFRTCLRV
mmetsp:Transcript_4349/g.8582  ORF Transcript_4349/g.8582 Transcript_4349/m.8582 type:complete len:89 (+) Transcript_4349:916-1182(+)